MHWNFLYQLHKEQTNKQDHKQPKLAPVHQAPGLKSPWVQRP